MENYSFNEARPRINHPTPPPKPTIQDPSGDEHVKALEILLGINDHTRDGTKETEAIKAARTLRDIIVFLTRIFGGPRR